MVVLRLEDFYFCYLLYYEIQSLFLDFTHASLVEEVVIASSIGSSSVNLSKED